MPSFQRHRGLSATRDVRSQVARCRAEDHFVGGSNPSYADIVTLGQTLYVNLLCTTIFKGNFGACGRSPGLDAGVSGLIPRILSAPSRSRNVTIRLLSIILLLRVSQK
ncbi:hypothetical protein PoB_005006700 [Plakobranchus ocellatus]|uniref:GST C-terminal domain-containing protein n=1 Tax=Plakobranchus ocellatus TaxID=259542 RepID=A0AAV4BW42_9GAST|nr:hypothetical protein PoB_005006700 [Plakobranchus ocellatus]